jgi:hypothetical protein
LEEAGRREELPVGVIKINSGNFYRSSLTNYYIAMIH